VQPLPPLPASPGPDPALRWIVPVGRSGWAIAAGYLGLLAVLVLPAPLAVVSGFVAVWDIQSHPGRLGMGRAVFGIVMGGLFSLFFFLPLLLAAGP
jgi:hypothetical protein